MYQGLSNAMLGDAEEGYVSLGMCIFLFVLGVGGEKI